MMLIDGFRWKFVQEEKSKNVYYLVGKPSYKVVILWEISNLNRI